MDRSPVLHFYYLLAFTGKITLRDYNYWNSDQVVAPVILEKPTLWQKLTDWDRSIVFQLIRGKNIEKKIEIAFEKNDTSTFMDVVLIGLPAIPYLLQALETRDNCARRLAAEMINKIAERPSEKERRKLRFILPRILKILNNEKDKTTVQELIAFLGSLGDQRAVGCLLNLSEKGFSFTNAFVGIAKTCGRTLETEKALPALYAALKDGNEFERERAIKSLCLLQEINSIPIIFEMLEDRSERVTSAAANALGKMAGVAAVAILTETFHFNVLYDVLSECKTIHGINEFEKGLMEGYSNLRKNLKRGKLPSEIQKYIAELSKAVAMRKDELSFDKKIIFKEKPKPPKSGKGIYRAMRVIHNG